MTPNPKYWFMSDRHQEALKQLMYGLDSKDHAQSSGGFVLLIGELGTGKATALHQPLNQRMVWIGKAKMSNQMTLLYYLVS